MVQRLDADFGRMNRHLATVAIAVWTLWQPVHRLHRLHRPAADFTSDLLPILAHEIVRWFTRWRNAGRNMLNVHIIRDGRTMDETN